MNVLKKFAISLTALTTLATLGIGSFSVSANELTEVNMNLLADTATEEEQFIASYKNADEKLAANYYIDNGISLAEAKTMMDIYQEGSREIAAYANSINSRAISTGTNFYNTSYLSSNQHYGVVIANNGSAAVDVSLSLNYQSNWISFNSPLGTNFLNANHDLSVRKKSGKDCISMSGYLPAMGNNVTPVGELEIPFNVVMDSANAGSETFSEGTLYHKFTFTREYCTPDDDNNDTTFCFETYVNGDVNHDGRVSAADSNYLTRYNLNEITLDEIAFTYTDKSANIARIVNLCAMDANKDGIISLADLNIVNATIE